MTDSVLRVAAKGLLVYQDRILILREADTYPEGTNLGSYGLPGGRINPGEPFMDGLHREIKEETGLKMIPEYPVYVGEWRPVIKDQPHQIIAIFYVCKVSSKKVKLSEEHDKFLWVNPKDYKRYNLMTPDDDVINTYLRMRQ